MTPVTGPVSKSRSPSFDFQDRRPPKDDFFREAILGLSGARKYIQPKFLYDERGSALFEEITQLPEYYLTRTEIALMKDASGDMAALIEEDGRGCNLIEYGCGNSQKALTILEALRRPRAYVAIDISRAPLFDLCDGIVKNFPDLEVRAICADFTTAIDLPVNGFSKVRNVAFFPGSSIGNFEPEAAVAFLKNVRNSVGPDGGMLIGVDLKKDPALLHAAYNDAVGVTARFNVNLLERMNRECGADFDSRRFVHHAFYDPSRERVEMHLVCLESHDVRLNGHRIRFREGESIHTENCYKYTLESFGALAARAGWNTVRSWTDARRLFSVHFLAASPRISKKI